LLPEAVNVMEGIKTSTKRGLFRVGYYHSQLRRSAFPGVAVLCYHGVRANGSDEQQVSLPSLHIGADDLDAHCRFISEACNPISLSHWLAAASGGPPLPPRPVLVTFDDGYRSVHDLALPILRKHGVPALAFICTGPVERGELFWFDAVNRLRGEATVDAMKRLPFEEWQAAAADQASRADPDDPNAPMTIENVRSLANSGLVEIGAHTVSHPILARTPANGQAEEMRCSKQRLEEWIGRPVVAFAYPNGEYPDDYDDATVKLAEAAGFTCAFTTNKGMAPSGTVSLEIPRLFVVGDLAVAELAHRLTYTWRRRGVDR
jgi:peptidoglycan/xylan/chitin deacetylase (PgdA/CDA1 family)